MSEVKEEIAKEKPSYVGHGSAQMRTLQVGHYLSQTSYLEVLAIRGMDVKVKDQRGMEFSIIQGGASETNNLINTTMHSATTYEKTVVCSRTELLEVFAKAGDAVYTATYRKQLDPEKAFDSVKTGNVLKSHADQKKAFKEAIKGELRVMTAHTISTETGMGRSLVYDLVNKHLKQVDHRTIERLILKGTSYVVK